MTAGDVVDRIKKNLGVAWRDTTYRDTFKSGGPDTPVTGIATTVFASFDMIQRAVGAGLNMIVPHEVTFWNDRDDVTIVSADPLYKQKLDFLTMHESRSSGCTITCTINVPTSRLLVARATSGSMRNTRRLRDRIDSRCRRRRWARWRPS